MKHLSPTVPILLLLQVAIAIPQQLIKSAELPIPPSTGSVTYPEPKKINGVFDGGMKTYGRGVKCNEQIEGGDADAVFLVEDGGTLKNAIIGPDQSEGVHCMGSCTIENVWWSAVCEDALTFKGDGDGIVKGGGAQHAKDKVIQHNGRGSIIVDGFVVMDFGKLYRACGNCKVSGKREVVVTNVTAYDGLTLTGINSNFGDSATIVSACATNVHDICQEYIGVPQGNEPKKLGAGPSSSCKYDPSVIKPCVGLHQAPVPNDPTFDLGMLPPLLKSPNSNGQLGLGWRMPPQQGSWSLSDILSVLSSFQ